MVVFGRDGYYTNLYYNPQNYMMNQREGIVFEISRRFTAFWHLITKHIID